MKKLENKIFFLKKKTFKTKSLGKKPQKKKTKGKKTPF